jgi:hypothetical protein
LIQEQFKVFIRVLTFKHPPRSLTNNIEAMDRIRNEKRREAEENHKVTFLTAKVATLKFEVKLFLD